MIISENRKRNLLVKRGFTPEEIESGFKAYIDEKRVWNINTIGPKELRDTYEEDEITKIFKKDSINTEFANPFPNDNFDSYSSIHENPLDDRVNAAVLEPYVARLVLAVNKCCIFTNMSCDGWHRDQDGKTRKLKLWMNDRYSTAWFWIIAETVFGEYWSMKKAWYDESWMGKFCPEDREADLQDTSYRSMLVCRIPEGMEKRVYKRINDYADFMERNSATLCELREKWLAMLQSSMDAKEIQNMGFLRLRRTILEFVIDDLKVLSAEWESFMADKAVE